MEIAALKKRGSSWRKGCGARLIVLPLFAARLTKRMDWIATGLPRNSETQCRKQPKKKQTERWGAGTFIKLPILLSAVGVTQKNLHLRALGAKLELGERN